MQKFSINDTKNMEIALKLANKGRYEVKSNPMVGCVITKNDKIIANGYHQTFGKEHAEINALKQINNNAKGATLYTTLEPCSQHGKTPPCTDAIINSATKKVIIAMLDPNPLENGKAIAKLKKANIEVKTGLLKNEALRLNRGFVKRMLTNMPFVVCKIAASLDGKTSMLTGESKWISCKASRLDAQYLRACSQAILTGSNTILKDNPSMTVRLNDINVSPLRVVIDSQHKITDKSLNIFSKDAATLILNSKNSSTLKSGKLKLKNVLTQLGRLGINNVLLEAGPNLIGAMTEANLIDEFIIYIAPILMGNMAHSMIALNLKSMVEKINLNISNVEIIDKDIKITATM